MAKSAYKKRKKRSLWSRLTVMGKALIGISLAVLIVCVVALVVSTLNLNRSGEPETVYAVYSTEAETESESKNYVGSKNVVVIDPGHGGTDGGSVSNGMMEKEHCLTISLLVKEKLEKAGITVIMTRSGDATVSKERRVEIANATDACLFVSIHRNNYEGNENARGIEAWIEKSGPSDAVELSNCILNKLNSLFANNNRGVHTGSTGEANVNYYVNGHTAMTSTLIELGFLSNAADNSVVLGHSDECAQAIADGILEYLSRLK